MAGRTRTYPPEVIRLEALDPSSHGLPRFGAPGGRDARQEAWPTPSNRDPHIRLRGAHMQIRRGMVALLVAAAALVTPTKAKADGWESFGESYRATLPGGGVVSQGAGLSSYRQEPTPPGPVTGSIVIAGIPDGAGVERAFLYWA